MWLNILGTAASKIRPRNKSRQMTSGQASLIYNIELLLFTFLKAVLWKTVLPNPATALYTQVNNLQAIRAA